MLPEILFAIFLVVATVALFWYLARLAAVRVATQFEALANQFELELTRREPQWLGFHRPEPSLYGQYRGREISISVPGHGKQNTRQIETMLKVEVRDQRLSAQFNLKGWMASLEKKLSKGRTEWKSGDPAFDEVIEASSKSPKLLEMILTPERRQWLVQTLQAGKGSLYMGAGVLTYAELGLISDENRRQRFAETLTFLCDLAEAVEGQRST